MKRLLAIFGNILLLIIIFLPFGVSYAEEKKISEAELDQMMAPIALYPDSLLSQILMATTYPADVTEAVKWSKDNPKQEGDGAVKAVQDTSWDPSVMSLVAFPQVLTMMGKQPDWVKSVGDAFLAKPEDVMDTVQKLRKKAKDQGNLETTEQQKVVVEEKATETIIVIEPANPQVVYVPVYNTTVVYGTWWWPHYRPWYYYPPGYAVGSAVMRGVGFAVGVGITHALWGNCSWGRGHGNVNINVNRYNNINVNNKINSNNRNTNWNHKSNNRGNSTSRNKANLQKTNNNRSRATQRQDYRGRDAQRDQARRTLDKRAVSPSEGRKQLKGDGGSKARASVNQANRDFSHNKSSRNTGNTKQTNRASNSSRQSRNSAFKGAGNTRQTKQNINRGNSSNRSMSRQRSSGGRRSGGARSGGRR